MASLTASMSKVTTPWWLFLIEGIAAIIVGLLLLTNPTVTIVVLIQVLGIWWLVSGILDIVSLFIDRTSWGWKLFSGIIGILAGLVILQHPILAAVGVTQIAVIILGILGLVQGIMGLIGAFQGGGWVSAVLGIVYILVGLLLIFNQFAAGIGLWLLIAIFALVGGGIAIWQSFQIKKMQKA